MATYNPPGGGSFDPHSPGPIGDVTPGTIRGTDVFSDGAVGATTMVTGDTGARFGADAVGDLVINGDGKITKINAQDVLADGTYTLGIGGSQDGTITIVGGIPIAIQEALP